MRTVDTLHVSDSAVPTRLVKWEKVAKLSAASAEDAVDGRNAAPWSSVNNCTGAERRRLELELKSRGFEGNGSEIAILLRGSGLNFAGAGKVMLRNGRVVEDEDGLSNEMWPGWS